MNTHRIKSNSTGEAHDVHMTVGFNSTPGLDEQEPTKQSLVDVLEDRPIVRIPNLVDEEWCMRCDQKNSVRRKYNLPEEDGTLHDGHRVRLICGYNPDPNEGNGWVVRAVHHLDHPMLDKENAAVPGQAQAQVTAELDETGWTYTQTPLGDDDEPHEYHVEDRSVARDVEIEWFSPIGDGKEREPVREPDKHGIVELKTTDPRPNWPDEENAWRKEILQEHGDWNDDVPVVDISDTEPI